MFKGSIVHGVVWGICHSLKVDHPDLLGLPNPVGPGYSLLLILGVGVWVVHHHSVGCLQVEAPACCPNTQQEDEDLTVGRIEALDGDLPAAVKSDSSGCRNNGVQLGMCTAFWE